MKIVNTIKTILLLAVVVILPSCLDLDPQDQMSDANLWQTPNDYKLYANQFYEWTRDFRVPYMMVLIVIPVRT